MGFYKQSESGVKCGHNHHNEATAQKCAVDVGAPFVIRGFKREKYKSRSTRCSEAVSNFQSAQSTLEDIVSDIENLISDEDTFDATEFDATDIQLQLNAADQDRANGLAELESLRDEIQEIIDNASGTNLENTSRIQTFGDTVSTLEDAVNYAEEAEMPTVPSDITIEALETFKDELEECASSLGNAADAEQAEFPGMYS